jgi:endoglucanase
MAKKSRRVITKNFWVQNKPFRRSIAVTVIVLFAGIGVYLLTSSHAASPYATANADKGFLSSGATVIVDNSATDGNHVQFGGSKTAMAIKVSGDSFVNQSGQVTQLHGVNRPGTEYACAASSNAGFISDPAGSATTLAYADTVVSSLKTWNKTASTTNAINAVRIPLNEDCWLGINGVNPAYSSANYQAFILREVNDLVADNMYPILDLHWSAPGTQLANGQDVAPDADHSVTFWQQVASAYKDNPAVMFDLYNEPNISNGGYVPNWTCYLDGCTQTSARNGASYQTAGTQTLVNTIRGAGANNVIMVEGLASANDVWNYFGAYAPVDPQHNIAAEIHVYNFSGQSTPAEITAMLASNSAGPSVAGNYPVYVGEFGDNALSGTNGCGTDTTTFLTNLIGYMNSNGYSYTAWGWDQGEGCNGPSLVTNDESGATYPEGSIVQSALQALEQ